MIDIKSDYDVGKAFEEIETKLILSMKRNFAKHLKEEKTEGFEWSQWQALKLKQIKDFREENQAIYKTYENQINPEVQKMLKKEYKKGNSKVNKEALKAGILKKTESQLGGSFFGLNDTKITALMDSVNDDLGDVKYAVLRMTNDVYRSTLFKAQIYANSGAGTVKQAIDMATEDFLSRGLNCIEYSNGRRINIADYSDMAIRTATKRANLLGEGNKRKNLGISTVYISRHGSSCLKCGKYEGKVYIDDIWSGGTEEESKKTNYSLLSLAVKGGLFHPRCRHGSSTFFPDINELPEDNLDINEHEHNNEKLNRIQYLKRQEKKYNRLALGSLDEKNQNKYKSKCIEIKQEIANLEKNDIIDNNINIEKCENYQELSKYVKNKWGIDDIDEKVIKNYQYDGVLETFIEMDKVYGDFPQLKGFVKRIEPDSLGVMSTNWAGIKHGQMINSNDKFNSVNIQFGKIYKDYSNVIKNYATDVSTNFHPKGTTSAVNGIHELGHAIEAYLINKKGYEFEWQKVIAWNDKEISGNIVKEAQNNAKKTILGKGKTNKELKGEISRYAFKDDGETLAESFSDYYSNGDKAAILSQEIVKIVKEMMK